MKLKLLGSLLLILALLFHPINPSALVTVETPRISYVAGGGIGDVTFYYNFKIFQSTDLLVYDDNVLQTLNVHYTVLMNSGGIGGSITFVTAPVAASIIDIVRSIPLTQSMDLREGDRLPAETLESTLDKQTMTLQDLNSKLNAFMAGGGVLPLDPTVIWSMIDHGGFTLKSDDLFTKSPWVDIRSFMDGVAGRPTYATWVANQATTDVSSVIQATIDSLTSAGEIKFPLGTFIVNAAAVTIGAYPIILEGIGWKSDVVDVFGNANWNTGNAVKGSVLKVTGTSDGIVTNNVNQGKLIIRDLAILGPGSGTSVGINMGLGATNSYNKLDNVLIANFYKGLALNDAISNSFYDPDIRGCTYGIYTSGAVADQNFYYPKIQACGDGIYIGAGSGVRFYGGLIQANTRGLKIIPASAAVTNLSFYGQWFEGNTGGNIVLDTTNFSINYLTFQDVRSSNYGISINNITSIGRLHFKNCHFPAATLTLAPGIVGVLIEGGTFAAIIPNGAIAVTKILAGDDATGGYTVSSVSQQRYYNNNVGGAFTPDLIYGENQEYLLTSAPTFAVPDNEVIGSNITFILRQDGTGGWDVTWAAGYHTSWDNTGNTASKYSSITFRCIGSGQWVQVGAQFPWTI